MSGNRPRGALLTVEGVEGAGKTTQASRLVDALRASGREAVLTREPGGTALGRDIRRMLLSLEGETPAPEAELLLYLADRAQHVRRLVAPAIERGAIVVADRFSDSTIAYQAWGRALPLETVRAIDDFARGGVAPLLTFVLDLEPEAGLARARATGPADRLESEAIAFHRRVREGFRAIAAASPDRVVVLDASRPVEELSREIASRALARLGPT
ncbi:MAG: dTMP kinase [Alphaproteobacteria bacterium]